LRSPTASWLVASSPSRVASPVAPLNQTNGTHISSPSESRPVAGHQKNRLSLTFLRKGSVSDSREGRQTSKAAVDDEDLQSNATSARSRSKDAGKQHRLSFLHHTSTNESFPLPPPKELSSQTKSQTQSHRSQSSERRPETGKSEQLNSHSLSDRAGRVRKRLSLLHIGKKPSKASVKSRHDATLVEE
jgi:hypothetical protein